MLRMFSDKEIEEIRKQAMLDRFYGKKRKYLYTGDEVVILEE